MYPTKMLEVVEFIYNNRFKTFWDQRIAWKVLMYDIRGLSDMEKEIVLDTVMKRHEEESNNLNVMYPYTPGWYKRGAWQQSVLDEHLFNMMRLVHEHSDVR